MASERLKQQIDRANAERDSAEDAFKALAAANARAEAAERERDEVARINRTVGYDWSRAFNSWRIDFEQRITVAEADRDEAVGLLREYGEHRPTCSFLDDYDDPKHCTCGFISALARLPSAAEGS